MDSFFYLTIFVVFFIFECIYYRTLPSNASPSQTSNKTDDNSNQNQTINTSIVQYKYPLITGMEVVMEYKNGYTSSYDWFMKMKYLFVNIGGKEKVLYPKNTPTCKVDTDLLGPIKVAKDKINLDWVEKRTTDVKLGGYYAPAHCRPVYKVAIIVPYRDRPTNLAVFLRYIHPLLKKQLLEYRIFVIEQYGTEKFNKGTLYNIAFLETQRFGTWHCLIFHDVDLIAEDERISYSCPKDPTHMASAVESLGYVLPYSRIFGGVTALIPKHYKKVNGYSNTYWSWGAEDDDFYTRLKTEKLTVQRYNGSVARYASMSHNNTKRAKERGLLLSLCRHRFQREGLSTVIYKLLNVSEEKLFTHILADVNPMRLKLSIVHVLRRLIKLFGDNMYYGPKQFYQKDLNLTVLRSQ